MNIKKLLVLPLVASVGLGSNIIFANNKTEIDNELDYVSGTLQPEIIGAISSVNGKITGINEIISEDIKSYYLSIKTDDLKNYIISIDENTVFIKDGNLVNINSLEDGMDLTVHFKNDTGIISGPLVLDINEEDIVALEQGEDITINIIDEGTVKVVASAIVISTEVHPVNVHVDYFDKYLVSSDFNLRLDIHEDTVIVDTDNNTYEGSLENKKLAIIYFASTRSLPAIPLQPKIIVLGDADLDTLDFSQNITSTELPFIATCYFSTNEDDFQVDPVIVVDSPLN